VSGQRTGFTLVEIVVVLSILALVTAMALPSLMRAGPDEDARAAQDVARLLRAARAAALEAATPVTATLLVATGAYLVQAETDSVATVLAQGILALPSGVHLASSHPSARFGFGPLGVAHPDSIAVVGSEGSTMVLVDRWTGDISVRAAAR
jgi:prepilin-type N-terminal cleavage/methylation domain-containing protein